LLHASQVISATGAAAMKRALRSNRVALSAAFLGLAASATAGCGTPQPQSRPPAAPSRSPAQSPSPTVTAAPASSTPGPAPSSAAPPPSIAPAPPPPDDYVLYCVDESQIVVDQSLCDLDLDGYHDQDYYIAYDRDYLRGLPIGALLVGGLFAHAQDVEARNALRLGSAFRNSSTVRAGTVGATGGGTTIGG
jgi:hypothetical protein